MKVEFTKRSREYGYFIWPRRRDKEFESVFGNLTEADFYLGDWFLGKKRIDRKYRRISLGYKYTKALPESTKVLIAARKDLGSVIIKYK